MRRSVLGVVICLAAAISGPTAAATQARPAATVLVFAAASLQTALDALAMPAEQATGVTMRLSYAASSTLANQIVNGAPADLFISADVAWMDYLHMRALIHPSSRVTLIGNELVLIAPRASPVRLTIAPGFRLAEALGRDRLALADPAVVPAGKYARAALTSLGVWDAVAGRIAAAENVRGALRLVALGEAPLGIVYRTDALVEPAVTILGTFPASTHPPIVYPIALTSTASPFARPILDFLTGAAGRKVFVDQGFSTSARE